MSDFKTLSPTGKLFVLLFTSYGVLCVAALWFNFLASELFFKITATYVVAIIVLAIVYLIRREFIDDEKAKNEKYMD